MVENGNNFTAISWTHAKDALRGALGDYLNKAGQRVEKGQEHVYHVCNRAVCLLRAEGVELVVVGFSGVGHLAACAPVIAAKAKARGFTSIRVHTTRKGECRFLNKHGLPFVIIEHRDNGEFVMRMEIT